MLLDQATVRPNDESLDLFLQHAACCSDDVVFRPLDVDVNQVNFAE
jgi:hypothetical protein